MRIAARTPVMGVAALLLLSNTAAIGPVSQEHGDGVMPLELQEAPCDPTALRIALLERRPTARQTYPYDYLDSKWSADMTAADPNHSILTDGLLGVTPGTYVQADRPPLIRFTLCSTNGCRVPVTGLAVTALAGEGDTRWPVEIHAFVSDDDSVYSYAASLLSRSAVHDPPLAEYPHVRAASSASTWGYHTFWTNDLNTSGRYLLVVPRGWPGAVLSEIEVYTSPSRLPRTGRSDWMLRTAAGDVPEQLQKHLRSGLAARDGVIRQIVRDVRSVGLEALAARNAGKIDDGDLRSVLCQLDHVRTGVYQTTVDLDPSSRLTLPFNADHARVFAARASLWRMAGLQAPFVRVWQGPQWDKRSLDDVALGASPLDDGYRANRPPASPRVHVVGNEFRSASFDIVNGDDANREVELRIRIGNQWNPDFVLVHSVPWTGSQWESPIAAALVPMARSGPGGPASQWYALSLPPGMSHQLWLTITPEHRLVPGQAHDGVVQVRVTGSPMVQIPLRITVHPYRLPDRHTLQFGVWDYTDDASAQNYGMTSTTTEAVRRHIASRVNAPWAGWRVVPPGVFDTLSSSFTVMPDTSRFAAWIDDWRGVASTFNVFLMVEACDGAYPTSFWTCGDSIPIGSPHLAGAVEAWAKFWDEQAKRAGITLRVLFFGEPNSYADYVTALRWGRAARSGRGTPVGKSGLEVVVNPEATNLAGVQDPMFHQMIAESDVVLVYRPAFYAPDTASNWGYLRGLRNSGKAIETSSSSRWLPIHINDPHAHARLQPWIARRDSLEGSHFWAAADNGSVSGSGRKESSWREFENVQLGRNLTPWSHELLFVDSATVTGSKHMEAAREGVQDYGYFLMADSALAYAEACGAEPAATAARRERLASWVTAVVGSRGTRPTRGSSYWSHDIDRTAADSVRLRILDLLDQAFAIPCARPRPSFARLRP